MNKTQGEDFRKTAIVACGALGGGKKLNQTHAGALRLKLFFPGKKSKIT